MPIVTAQPQCSQKNSCCGLQATPGATPQRRLPEWWGVTKERRAALPAAQHAYYWTSHTVQMFSSFQLSSNHSLTRTITIRGLSRQTKGYTLRYFQHIARGRIIFSLRVLHDSSTSLEISTESPKNRRMRAITGGHIRSCVKQTSSAKEANGRIYFHIVRLQIYAIYDIALCHCDNHMPLKFKFTHSRRGSKELSSSFNTQPSARSQKRTWKQNRKQTKDARKTNNKTKKPRKSLKRVRNEEVYHSDVVWTNQIS